MNPEVQEPPSPATNFRVVLLVSVNDEDIVRSRDEEALKDLKTGAEDDSYLRFYIEDEMAWLHQSFSNVKVETVERLVDVPVGDDYDQAPTES